LCECKRDLNVSRMRNSFIIWNQLIRKREGIFSFFADIIQRLHKPVLEPVDSHDELELKWPYELTYFADTNQSLHIRAGIWVHLSQRTFSITSIVITRIKDFLTGIDLLDPIADTNTQHHAGNGPPGCWFYDQTIDVIEAPSRGVVATSVIMGDTLSIYDRLFLTRTSRSSHHASTEVKVLLFQDTIAAFADISYRLSFRLIDSFTNSLNWILLFGILWNDPHYLFVHSSSSCHSGRSRTYTTSFNNRCARTLCASMALGFSTCASHPQMEQHANRIALYSLHFWAMGVHAPVPVYWKLTRLCLKSSAIDGDSAVVSRFCHRGS